MTPNQMGSHTETVRTDSGLNFLAGLWFFVSPWVYSTFHMRDAWNSWIVGAIIAIFAAIRFAIPGRAVELSSLNLLLGIWAFLSPWIYGYTMDTGWFVNSLCVGAVVFVLSISSLVATSHRPAQHPQ